MRTSPSQWLVSEVAELPPGRALDLGCGGGRNAVWLAARGWTVTAVDFSEVGIAQGREMAKEQEVDVTWVVADLRDYQPAERAFELVIDFYTHLPQEHRRQLWRKGAAAVAPGGTMLVVGHDLTNLDEGHGGPQQPAALFTPGEITAELEELEIVKAVRVRRTVDTPEGEFEAIDALVLARNGREHPAGTVTP